MSRWAWILALIATGCGAERALPAIPPPPEVEGAQGWLLGLREGRETQLVARADPRGPTEWTVGQADLLVGASLVAYAYDRDLAELGLTDGMVALDVGRSCLLEAPVAAYALELDLPEAGWIGASTTLDEGTRQILFGGTACASARACDPFVPTQVETSTHSITTIVQIDDAAALAADTRGHFWRLDGGVATPQPDLEGLPSYDVARDDAGRWWFGGRGTEIAVGPLEGPFERYTVATATQSVRAVLPAPPGAWAVVVDDGVPDVERGAELWVLDAAAGTWTRRHRVVDDQIEHEKVDLLALDDTIVVTYGTFDAFIVEPDGVRPIFVGRGDFLTQVSAVLHPLGPRTFASGGRRGELVTIELDSGVTDRRALLLPDTIYAVMPDGEGFIVAGAGGWVRQIWLDETPCPEEQWHPGEIWTAARVGDRVYLGGRRPDALPTNQITVLTRP